MNNEIKYKHTNATDHIPEMVPPGALNNVNNKTSKDQSLLLMILIGVVISLLLIIIFILFKPDNPQILISHESTHVKDHLSSVKPNDSKPVEIKPEQADQKLIDKLEKLVNQWLFLDSEAEQKHYSQWADKEIIQARKDARQGDQYIRQSEHRLAAISYQNAISLIQQVKISKSSVLTSLLNKADKALASDDWKTAKQLYAKSLLIEGDNKQAQYGLKRSTHLPEVIALYLKASGLLTTSNSESIEKYQEIIVLLDKAIDIDKEYQPAAQLIQEIHKKNEYLKFQLNITQSMESLKEKKFSSARHFLAQAKEIKAQDPAVEKINTRIIVAEKSYQIRRLKQIALQQEKQEKWAAAIDTYNKILKIEAKTLFAIKGKLQAETYHEWYQKLNHIIDHPERLQSEKIRRNAAHWVTSIRKSAAANLAQLDKLEMKLSLASKLIDESNIEVRVELISDNETQIDIYKVGRLGQFKQKSVILKPGKYTVVGSRTGYRDVRIIIEINLKNRNPRYSVICKEMI